MNPDTFPGEKKKKLLTISPTLYYVIWPNNSLSLSEASLLEAELLNFYSEKEHFTISLSWTWCRRKIQAKAASQYTILYFKKVHLFLSFFLLLVIQF